MTHILKLIKTNKNICINFFLYRKTNKYFYNFFSIYIKTNKNVFIIFEFPKTF